MPANFDKFLPIVYITHVASGYLSCLKRKLLVMQNSGYCIAKFMQKNYYEIFYYYAAHGMQHPRWFWAKQATSY